MEERPVVDFDTLRATLGGDREMIRLILRQLRETLRIRRDELHRAVAGGDPREVHAVSHPLKGALAGVAAEEARHYIERVDDAARGDDMDGARAAYEQAGAALQRLEDALAEYADDSGTGEATDR